MALNLSNISISQRKESDNPANESLNIENVQKSRSSPLYSANVENAEKSGHSKLYSIDISERYCIQCTTSERDIAFATRVVLPDTDVIPDKGFKECCYNNIVLASLDDDDGYKNDYNSWYFRKQLTSDSCDFVLIDNETGDEYALNDSTYGEFKPFGSYPDQIKMTTYRVDWRKVLQTLGEGVYSMRLDQTIAGITFPQVSNSYKLQSYSIERANNSIRIDSVMNGRLEHIEVDFKGVNFKNTLRSKGFFGNRNPKFTQDNLVRREKGYDEQISMIQENEYVLEMGLIPECITTQIYDFILFSDEIFLSDYNTNNHSYRYKVLPVVLKNNKGAKYYVKNRDSRVNLVFEDRYKNKRKINC